MSNDYGVPDELKPLLGNMLGATPTPATGIADQPLDDVTTQDFSYHEFLFDLQAGFTNLQALSSLGETYLSNAKSKGLDEFTLARIRNLLESLENTMQQNAIATGLATDEGKAWINLIEDMYYANPMCLAWLILIDQAVQDTYSLCSVLMEEIHNYFASIDLASQQNKGELWASIICRSFQVGTLLPNWSFNISFSSFNLFINEINNLTSVPTRKPTTGIVGWWVICTIFSGSRGSVQVAPYEFEIAPPRSTNIGLRLNYRQFWRPLALQRGELVRTIPLGPGQKERVSVKIVNRRKSTSSKEYKKEIETTTETANTAKDATEVLAEAATSLNWKVSGKYGAGGAEISGSVGGSAENKSKNTSSALSEAVSKTASKMRSETKVTVSTETESTFEQERASEIINPNNEIAVTYEYYKLQQQYDVLTQLNNVEGVIYVAEKVPTPIEVNIDWVRRYDWILSKALKDESFRGALDAASLDTEMDVDPLTGKDDPFAKMLDQANLKFAEFTGAGSSGFAPGLSIPDIYAKPQELYQDRIRDIEARTRANTLRNIQRERLLQHLRDNILYYCRAIWAAEDRDQRFLRYRKENRMVPSEWESRLGPSANTTTVTLDGWVPTGATVPLVEVIDPMGPLGFVGNYSVWSLKPSNEQPKIVCSGNPKDLRVLVNLPGLMLWAKSPYVDTSNGGLLDPALTASRNEAKALSLTQLASLTDSQVWDFLSYFPELVNTMLSTSTPRKPMRDANNLLVQSPTTEQWAQYLYRSNGTRRFLIDTDTVYLALRIGEGAALEPFKRLHRYLDVLRAAESVSADGLRNERRKTLMNDAGLMDPDIQKVVVVGSSSQVTLGQAAAADTNTVQNSPSTPD